MGYDTRKIKIIGRVSRHNSEQDAIDDQLWDDLREVIDSLIFCNPEFKRVVSIVDGPE